MDAVTDLVLERYRGLLRQGAILVDPMDQGEETSRLVLSRTCNSELLEPLPVENAGLFQSKCNLWKSIPKATLLVLHPFWITSR